MKNPPSSIQGFTLVELMVVIVIMGIMASLVMMNMSGTDQRKAMQAREVFIMDVQRILRESNDQSRILALNSQPASDADGFQYGVMEYLPQKNNENNFNLLSNQNNHWQNYQDFPIRVLPENVTFSILPLDRRYENANSSELLNQNSPKLIWLGNGEIKPVRVQFYFENRPVGNEIEIDYLGKITE